MTKVLCRVRTSLQALCSWLACLLAGCPMQCTLETSEMTENIVKEQRMLDSPWGTTANS